jgi:hypothetical protein
MTLLEMWGMFFQNTKGSSGMLKNLDKGLQYLEALFIECWFGSTD